MDAHEKFKDECSKEIADQGADTDLAASTREWMERANARKYSYHFEWLGRPIIQYPQDIVAMQELIWSVRPQLIIETGIAHGGSLIFSASMLELIAACGAGDGRVVGIDIDIRPHNRQAIQTHPLAKRITMIEGSSIEQDVIDRVHAIAKDKERILVCLDSNHAHDHVLAELDAYAPLASVGSYCVVFDTVIEDLPVDSFPGKPWRKGSNAKTAVWKWLESHPEFVIDASIQNKLLATVAPDGYLRRIS